MLRDIFEKNSDLTASSIKVKPNRTDYHRTEKQFFTPVKRILLIDDDPIFGRILVKAAQLSGKTIEYCKSVDAIGNLKSMHFDVAIVDYDLGAVTGIEIASYIEQFAGSSFPFVLVSQTQRSLDLESNQNILKFIHKFNGPEALIAEVVEVTKQWRKSMTSFN